MKRFVPHEVATKTSSIIGKLTPPGISTKASSIIRKLAISPLWKWLVASLLRVSMLKPQVHLTKRIREREIKIAILHTGLRRFCMMHSASYVPCRAERNISYDVSSAKLVIVKLHSYIFLLKLKIGPDCNEQRNALQHISRYFGPLPRNDLICSKKENRQKRKSVSKKSEWNYMI